MPVELPFEYKIFRKRMGEAALKCGQIVEVLSMGKPEPSQVELALALLYEIQSTVEEIAKDLREAREKEEHIR